MAGRRPSVRRARRARSRVMEGYLVTWDVDSRDAAMCGRLRRFVFGYAIAGRDRTYRYPGFVERRGVRYVGQSVLFVTPERREEIIAFLHGLAIDHVVVEAVVGRAIPC